MSCSSTSSDIHVEASELVGCTEFGRSTALNNTSHTSSLQCGLYVYTASRVHPFGSVQARMRSSVSCSTPNRPAPGIRVTGVKRRHARRSVAREASSSTVRPSCAIPDSSHLFPNMLKFAICPRS